MTKQCTTHHNACDCREEYIKKLEQALEVAQKHLKDLSKPLGDGTAKPDLVLDEVVCELAGKALMEIEEILK